MGEVILNLKVLPSSPDVDLEVVKNKIKTIESDKVRIQEIREEPIAFGLKALKVLIVMPDKEISPSEVEDKIRSIEGVENVETEGVTLL